MEEKKKRQKRTNGRAAGKNPAWRGKFVAGAYKNLGPSFSLSLIAYRASRVVCTHGTALPLHPGSKYHCRGHVKCHRQT